MDNPIYKLSTQYFLTIMDWEVLRKWEEEDKARYKNNLVIQRIKILSIIKEVIKYKLMNLNKVFLLGRVTNDIELKRTPSGQSVCTFNLATNRFYKVNEDKKEEVCFHRIVVWTKLAETIQTFVKKGDPIFIEGRIANRTYEDKQGNKKSISEVIAENVQFMPKPKVEKKAEPEDEEIPVIEDGEELDIKDIPF